MYETHDIYHQHLTEGTGSLGEEFLYILLGPRDTSCPLVKKMLRSFSFELN